MSDPTPQERDTVTGLPARPAVVRKLEQAVSESADAPLSVVLFDVDRLAAVQERHGPSAGDALLRQVAGILSEHFAPDGFVGRLSGDSFIVILPGRPSEAAFVLAEEVRRLFAENDLVLQADGAAVTAQITLKAGLASSSGGPMDAADLLRSAEDAAFRASRQGGNRIALPDGAQMALKTSYYTRPQLERLTALAKRLDRTEASLLREALDRMLRDWDDRAGPPLAPQAR